MKALIVSKSQKSTMLIKELFNNAVIDDITIFEYIGDARRDLANNEYDLCVINAPLTDEYGEMFAKYLAYKRNCSVILLVPFENYDEISQKVEEHGVITLSKPVNKALLWNALKMCLAQQKKIESYQYENKKLREKIEDIKLVDRAKCLLIEKLHYSEDEAHKFIEKESMELRVSRKTVAQDIINTHDV